VANNNTKWRVETSLDNGKRVWTVLNQKDQVLCVIGDDLTLSEQEHTENARYFRGARDSMTCLRNLRDTKVLAPGGGSASKRSATRRALSMIERFESGAV
jgi:hypothetical protein